MFCSLEFSRTWFTEMFFSLELVNPLQVTHLPSAWDRLHPQHIHVIEGIVDASIDRHADCNMGEIT